ncbi:MAG: 4Fe-4S dicluster domain-containing protein [Deltaproteobacteria bacterium]|nr:4Fe-4S dicluster domain-containing protein [Deltaproteobacteria bacterium]
MNAGTDSTTSFTRRELLEYMAALTALLASPACIRQPLEKILPYSKAPEDIVPGRPLFFATAMEMQGVGIGLLAESHMGRPTKLEGNPDHPTSLGATDAFAQAAILSLYDPDRSQVVTHKGVVSTWESFERALHKAMQLQEVKKGAGLRIVTETVCSPSLIGQLNQLLQKYPAAKWIQYDPICSDGLWEGARLAFGTYVQPIYRFNNADVVVSLENDFLADGFGSVAYCRQFMNRRRLQEGQSTMNRLYVLESTPSCTGVAADHRFAIRSSDLGKAASEIARLVGLKVDGSPSLSQTSKWITALASDLKKKAGRSLILAGTHQSAQVHALVYAINSYLGNIGRTIDFIETTGQTPWQQVAGLKKLYEEMRSGSVDMLVLLGGNLFYNAPVDLNVESLVPKIAFSAHLSLHQDETSSQCEWHLPQTHFLEQWSDVRGHEGSACIVQPLIAPLYGGKSRHEILSAMLGRPKESGYESVREYWKSKLNNVQFEKTWRKFVHDGILSGSAAPTKPVQLKDVSALPSAWLAQGEWEATFRADPATWDGRFANNAWLQECPRPITKLTWDNAALISVELSERYKLKSGDIIELECGGRTLKAPVLIVPGQAAHSITLPLGYGRTRAGRIGSHVGFNAYRLRTSERLDVVLVKIKKSGVHHSFAITQEHHEMEGRDLVRLGALDAFLGNPLFLKKTHKAPPDYPKPALSSRETDYAWGMSIDLGSCIGCNACVVACQAENNIPVVGKEGVERSREMHWLRIDRYHKGQNTQPNTQTETQPEMLFMPVPCMHCETAPCEIVCPVNATTHSADGLNQMVYNRCVGTRYCSNNCPYKVRRFNFFEYTDQKTPVLKMLRNPDVTVRSRGVMEKCTYCIQRIHAARVTSEKEGRLVRDGEVKTACQAACPTEAIVFGNINDPNSRVSRLKAHPLDYGLLEELNTRPRTTYLARIKNRNQEIKEG